MKHTIINSKQALAILPFVSRSGLYRGCKGTSRLTRFPYNTYSKEECEALRDEMIASGVTENDTPIRIKRRAVRSRECPKILV